ncbi:MAG: selenide, water dikinase SelD, partial [Deltaproteobacteria bacterium]|nr:selenide, water dikinase SelD [Deltaproteobacteria bacterium]
GQIAAANAISDVYAMGGRPITCLNLVAFPSGKLAPEVLHRIVGGAVDKITEAGAVLIGGHTIEDDEPKFGLAVNGIVHPDRLWTNAGARPGDVLVLTKPIGSGVLFNANIKNWVSEQALADCITHLTTLNRVACETMQRFDIHAVTDVTGFGLAGHSYEVARASGVLLTITMDRLPVMREALEMYRRGVNTGVNPHNRRMVADFLQMAGDWPTWHQEILYDPQTSGGLLAAVAPEEADALVDALHAAGIEHACRIGEVMPLAEKTILLRIV